MHIIINFISIIIILLLSYHFCYCRFGHAAVELDDHLFLVHGGFGVTSSQLSQSRLKSLITVKMNSEQEWKINEHKTTGDDPG